MAKTYRITSCKTHETMTAEDPADAIMRACELEEYMMPAGGTDVVELDADGRDLDVVATVQAGDGVLVVELDDQAVNVTVDDREAMREAIRAALAEAVEIEEPSRTPTVELGRRLLVLYEECGRPDWSVVDCPEAAAIIEELQGRGRDSEMAREWLARAGVEAVRS